MNNLPNIKPMNLTITPRSVIPLLEKAEFATVYILIPKIKQTEPNLCSPANLLQCFL